eukprot:7284131-Prorocentrum_lima.AAC.1
MSCQTSPTLAGEGSRRCHLVTSHSRLPRPGAHQEAVCGRELNLGIGKGTSHQCPGPATHGILMGRGRHA